jgi:hypothetical protein
VWVPGSLSPEIKQLGCEALHSPPSSAEVKNIWGHNSTPPVCFIASYLINRYIFMVWYLVKQRDNFTFTFAFHCEYVPLHIVACHFSVAAISFHIININAEHACN